MEIQDVDPRADGAFAVWFAVLDAVTRHDRPDETGWLAQEQRVTALDGRPLVDGTPPPEEQVALLAMRDRGQVVAAGRLELPLTDNLHVAAFGLWVLPGARRRGVGGLLLEELTARAKTAGRTTLMTEVDEPPVLDGASPGRAFAEQAGFTPALAEVRRDLTLPVDPARLDALDADCQPHSQGYRLRTWRDRCPDDLLEDRAELGRLMSTDVPLGELSWQEEAWDTERVRRRERQVQRQGRGMFAAGAVHEQSGQLVAFTEVVVPLSAVDRVYQWETLVVGAHRGHRLGTLVKTAVLRRLAVEVPAARSITTVNAGVNRPMIAVNEALGFVPNGTLTSWQREI